MNMNKINWKRKLTSRKLWFSISSFISMLLIATTGNKEVAVQVSALIMAGATVIGYVIGEGLIDIDRKVKTNENSTFIDFADGLGIDGGE